MKNKTYKIKSKIWRWPGDVGWHFVTLEKKLSKDIRDVYGKGFVKIQARVGKSVWATSLFPHKESNAYLICVNKKIRKEEDIFEGDEMMISFSIV